MSNALKWQGVATDLPLTFRLNYSMFSHLAKYFAYFYLVKAISRQI